MTSMLKAAAVAIAAVALVPAPASLFAQATPPVVFGYNQIPAEAPLASRIGGTVLLNELGCVNCHAPGALGTVTGGKSGPDLRRSSALKPGFLEAWLAAPHEVKPGTTMPDLLATLPAAEREQTAADLAAYLRSLASTGAKPAGAAAPDVAQGATLFHSVGCVACHSPAQPPPAEAMGPGAVARAPEFPSVPYGRLGDKYTMETLADFLQHPHDWRPAGRMPSFALTAQEAASIAGWLMAKGPQTGAAIKAARRTGNVQAGKTHFQKLQCAACHDVGEGAAKPAAKALVQLKWDAAKSCVAATPAAGLPHYALSAKQADSIRAAATAAAPLEQRAAMQAQLASLNCTACHVRDTLGGPENGRALYFEGSGEDLGEEGRMPPRLTHAGYKIIPEALTEIIANGVKLRPYFKTRMPAFGKTLAPALAGAFEKCDLPKNFKTLDQKGRNEAGRKLVGTTGMSCIACHPLNGHKSLGISAVDLVKSMPRLRAEWFAEFLQNPAAFNPGTRMPSFWPDAKVAKIQADADAIRVYLMEADQARLPDGLTSSQSYELVPSQKPVIFRTFIEGAGTQGIAVGYPQGLNVAFDAETASWAMAWKGRFLDAEATWFERPNPPAVPLGTDVLKLMAAGAPLAHLENDQAPWPAPYGEASKVRYLGFRVDRAGVPTFRYRFDGTEVTDRIDAGNDGRSLTRVVEWTGGSGTTAVRLATGKTIEAKDAATWRVGGKWDVKVLMPANAKVAVRPTAGGKEQEAVLLLPAGTGANQVRYQMQW